MIFNLHPFCCIADNIPTKQAPCENPNKPSKGPCSLNVFSTNCKVSVKPIAGPPTRVPLNV